MKRPNFISIFEQNSDFCEKNTGKDSVDLIPGQSLNLSELISRFERGQRLNVHNNFAPGSNFTNGNYEYVEDFDDAAPDDVHDIVDVQRYYEEHQQRKQDFASKKNEKKESQQTQLSQVPQDPSKNSIED